MAVAERRRFDMGASDLFLVNTREESAANVALSLLDMRLRRIIAGADLAAASGDAESLGLHQDENSRSHAEVYNKPT